MNSPGASSEAGSSRSGSVTPTGIPSDLPISRDPDESRALTLQVYKEVWDEFHKWKVEYCKQRLLLLQKPLPPRAVAENALLEASNLRDDGGEPGEVEIIYICESEDDTPLHPGGSTVLMCETVHLELPENFTPHPRYESCTPAVQSIAFRAGSSAEHELEDLPFVPYADDPTFDAKGYLASFKWFAWEVLGDPDAEEIQFETLRRLYLGHGLPLRDIDATNVLPPLRANNQDGLIYKMTQRDELFWPGTMIEVPMDANGVERPRIDTRAHEPDIDDLRRRVESIVPTFCANPSCIQALCPRHVLDSLPVPPAVPRVTSGRYPAGDPCGDMCFRKISAAFTVASIEWVEPDIDELRCILEIIPDTIPCGLAKLVRKPCREVYILRKELIPNDKVYAESTKITIPYYRDENVTTEEYLAPGPCSHTGPCIKSNPSCICAEESVHCSRSCRCDFSCKRRWKGCRCVLAPVRGSKIQKSETCSLRVKKCPCRQRGWECDPSVCQCDNPKFLKAPQKWKAKKVRAPVSMPDGGYFCRNSDLQHGHAKIEIKRGQYGLGAFAVDPIPKDGFIGEYIGELIPTRLDKKEPLRVHLDLNYNFGYDLVSNLDSARVGNETRYINHATGKKANAVAGTRLVFGEQRVGLWTTRDIEKGEEILFDYGENYWIHKKKMQN